MEWRIEVLLILVGIGVVAQIYMLSKFLTLSHKIETFLSAAACGASATGSPAAAPGAVASASFAVPAAAKP